MSSWQAAGLDRVTFGIIKQLNTIMSPLVICVFNIILQSGIIPYNLLIGVIYPIPKKAEFTGYLKDIHPIMLLLTITNLVFTIISKCLTDFTLKHKVFHHTQTGHHPGLSPIDGIPVLKKLSLITLEHLTLHPQISRLHLTLHPIQAC